jgi:hypothetical protein
MSIGGRHQAEYEDQRHKEHMEREEYSRRNEERRHQQELDKARLGQDFYSMTWARIILAVLASFMMVWTYNVYEVTLETFWAKEPSQATFDHVHKRLDKLEKEVKE